MQISKLLLISLVFFAQFITPSFAKKPELNETKAQEIDNILMKWKKTETQINTAQVTFDRLILRSKVDGGAPIRNDIDKLVKERLLPLIDAGYSVEDLEIATHQLVNSEESKKHEVSASLCTCKVLDNRDLLLNSSSFMKDGKVVPGNTRSYSKDITLRYTELNNSASVSKRGSSVKKFSITDLRYVPDIEYLKNLKDLVVIKKGDEITVLKSNGIEIEFESKSGFIHKCVYLHEGLPINEVFQLHPTETQDCGKLPSIIMKRLLSQNGNVKFCLILIPKNVILNEELSAEDFQVKVPKGTKISRISETGKILGQEKTEESETDVLSFSKDIPDIVPRRTIKINATSGSGYIWLVVFNAVILLILLTTFLMKKRDRNNN